MLVTCALPCTSVSSLVGLSVLTAIFTSCKDMFTFGSIFDALMYGDEATSVLLVSSQTAVASHANETASGYSAPLSDVSFVFPTSVSTLMWSSQLFSASIIFPSTKTL